MSLTAIIISGAALLVGVGVGYYLRLVIALGKKGSMELEIKHMMIGAKEDAQKITDESKKKAEERIEELHQEEKNKEVEFKKTEDRLIKKEALLDGRQVEIDKEVENIKSKVEEVKKVKERVDGCQSAVARADAVTAFSLQVIEKGKHHFSIKLLDTQLTWTFLGVLGSKGQEKTQCIPIGVHGCWTGPSLSDQMLAEEGLHEVGEHGLWLLCDDH